MMKIRVDGSVSRINRRRSIEDIFQVLDDPNRPLKLKKHKINNQKPTSKPPMSCEKNAKPDVVRLRPPRKVSDMASNVDSQSPPQC